MTGDEARELFSRAVDGELSAEEQAAFDAVLAENRAVNAEFRVWKQMLGVKISSFPPPAKVPDLTSGVQQRLRERSGGRIYRDRFSRMGKGQQTLVIIAAVTVAVLLGVAGYMATLADDAGAGVHGVSGTP